MLGFPQTPWGKLRRDGDRVVEWHPLVAHCADVAACCEVLLERTLLGERLARLAGLERFDPVQVARLSALAAGHDLGKASLGFQFKSRADCPFTAGHVGEMLALWGASNSALLARLAAALRIETFEPWGDGCELLITAAFMHHGQPREIPSKCEPWLWEAREGMDPFEVIAELRESIERWFPLAFGTGGRPFDRVSPDFQHAFMGLVTLADWLGSDTRFFPYQKETDEADRMPFARKQAIHACTALGLDTRDARAQLGDAPLTFARVSEHPPRAAQQAVLDLPAGSGAGLEILEAETGSGKTEAALMRYLKLFQAGVVDGMYFALPTRTAATQIYERVVSARERAFPGHGNPPPVILAVPGYLSVDAQEGTRLAPFETLWPDGDFQYRGWAAENSKRYLAGAIAVGTIDQVLFAALALPHAHMRTVALLRQLLVVDEVHASDLYMERIFEAVLKRHLKSGGRAFLMSATLGAEAREKYLAWGTGKPYRKPSVEEARAMAYPLLSQADAGRDPLRVTVSHPGNPKTTRVRFEPWIARPAAIAEEALACARLGARVLILRNTVADARETQMALERAAHAAGADALCFTCEDLQAVHHARFARVDRLVLDRAVEKRFGKAAPAEGGVVAVATQTVQQSLDLDADVLLTDLCPMDVLLQRVGRLHRHAERNPQRPPAFREPAPLILLTPESRELGRLLRSNGEARGEHGLGSVYESLFILEATWRALESHRTFTIPQDARVLVESSLHSMVLAEVLLDSRDERWRAHANVLSGTEIAEKQAAGINLASWKGYLDEPGSLFPRGMGAISSRLGEADRHVAFPMPLKSPFGQDVTEMTIPAHMVRDLPFDLEFETARKIEGGFEFTASGKIFRYDRLGLTIPKEREESFTDA